MAQPASVPYTSVQIYDNWKLILPEQDADTVKRVLAVAIPLMGIISGLFLCPTFIQPAGYIFALCSVCVFVPNARWAFYKDVEGIAPPLVEPLSLLRITIDTCVVVYDLASRILQIELVKTGISELNKLVNQMIQPPVVDNPLELDGEDRAAEPEDIDAASVEEDSPGSTLLQLSPGKVRAQQRRRTTTFTSPAFDGAVGRTANVLEEAGPDDAVSVTPTAAAMPTVIGPQEAPPTDEELLERGELDRRPFFIRGDRGWMLQAPADSLFKVDEVASVAVPLISLVVLEYTLPVLLGLLGYIVPMALAYPIYENAMWIQARENFVGDVEGVDAPPVDPPFPPIDMIEVILNVSYFFFNMVSRLLATFQGGGDPQQGFAAVLSNLLLMGLGAQVGDDD